jgi:hypothetical protein
MLPWVLRTPLTSLFGYKFLSLDVKYAILNKAKTLANTPGIVIDAVVS